MVFCNKYISIDMEQVSCVLEGHPDEDGNYTGGLVIVGGQGIRFGPEREEVFRGIQLMFNWMHQSHAYTIDPDSKAGIKELTGGYIRWDF